MKKIFVIFLSFFVLHACGKKIDQNADSTAENTAEASTTSQNTEPEVENISEEVVKDAPLDKVSSILDYYKTLEAETNAVLKEQMKESMSEMPATFMKIETKDVANGYIKYTQIMAMGYSEMGYYTAEGGKHFIANVDFGCGPICTMTGIRFSELRGGKLIDKTKQYYPETLKQEVENAVKSKLKGDNSSMFLKVPQKGTSIAVGISLTDASEEDFIKVGELVFDKKTASFSFKKS